VKLTTLHLCCVRCPGYEQVELYLLPAVCLHDNFSFSFAFSIVFYEHHVDICGRNRGTGQYGARDMRIDLYQLFELLLSGSWDGLPFC